MIRLQFPLRPALGLVTKAGLILIGLLCSVTVGNSMTKRPPSFEQRFSEASAVLYVRIEESDGRSVNGTRCGTLYNGIIIEKFKGNDKLGDGKTISFGRYQVLNDDEEYLLFLVKHDSADEIYEQMKFEKNFSESKAYVTSLIECDGIVPGYLMDDDTQWEVEGDSVVITGLRPQSLPKSIHVNSYGQAQWFLRKEDVSAYLRQLGADEGNHLEGPGRPSASIGQ
jgi:hypothetical protein